MEKRRIIRGILVGIPALFVCLFLLAVIVLNTGWFRGYLRSEIIKQALEKGGARVQVGSVSTHWTHLGVDLNHVTVYAATIPAGSKAPPLLSADRLEVGVHFFPILRGRIELRELILEHPVVHIDIDAQGRSNLPAPPRTGGNRTDTTDEIFNLEIADCEIRSGEVYYNDAKAPLDAALHNLKFNAGYGTLSGNYTGAISYDGGRLAYGAIAPVQHALQIQFTAGRNEFSVNPLVLTTRASRLSVNAKLTNYQTPSIQGTYAGNLSTGELAQILRSSNLPAGNVALDGSLAYQPDTGAAPQAAFIRSLELNGSAHSDKLEFRTGQQPVAATAISAQYDLKDATLHVQDVNADVLGGHARANYEMAHMDAATAANTIDAAVEGVSLANASAALASRNDRRAPFIGTTNLTAKASWAGSLSNAVVQATLAIASPKQARERQRGIPVDGLVQITYSGPRNEISFGQSHLQTAHTQINLAGTLSASRDGNSTLSALVTTSDLSEAGELAAMIQNARAASGPPSRIPALGGSASLTLRATGATRDPRIQGQLTAQNLSVDGSHWNSLAVNLDANSSAIRISNGGLIASDRAQIAFSGRAGLHNWALTDSSPLQLHADVANMSVAAAEEIAQLHYPVTGVLNATLNVSGTKASPNGKAIVTLAKGSAWDEPIQSLAINAESHDGAIRSTLNLQIPAGAVSADASYALATQQYDLKLHGSGIHLEKIAALQKRGSVQGAADLEASGAGTLHDPQLAISFTAPQVQAAGQQITNLDARVNVQNRRANLALKSVIYQGSVEAKGDVALTGAHESNVTLDVRALPVAAVAANFIPSMNSKVGGQTEIHLTASGPLSAPAQMQAHLEIPALNISYGKAQIGLAHALLADYRGGTLTIAPTQIQGTGTNLTFGGTLPIRSAAPYSLAADGSMDLGVIQQFAPGVKSSGEMEVHIRSAGRNNRTNGRTPGMQGQFQIKDAVFATETSPIGVEGLNARINLSGTRAEIANFSGTAGGGQVSARGFLDFGGQKTFSIAVNANSVRIRYPEGLRSILNGQLNLQGNTASSSLTGRVIVNSLSFTQAFDLADFAGAFSGESPGGAASAFAQNMRLSVSVLSSQDINLANSKLSIGGSANMNVVGTLAQPVVLGRIALNSGEVFFLGKRFEIQSGTIQFANPARTEPVLHMFINTTIEQYAITLNLSGPIDRLRTNYTSDPALPPADVIHLLAFGNTNEEAQSQPSQSAAMGAESVLAQGVGSQVAGKLENITGVSQLTIDPLATNSSGDPGAHIAIQQRVTGSLLFTFSSSVTTTQGQTVQLQYNLNKRTSVTVLRDQNGGYGIDLRLHKVF